MTELDKRSWRDQPSEAMGPSSGVAVRTVEMTFHGPLPHPRLLAQYNDAVADGAERILRLTETEAQHRRALETRTQIFTFVIAAISLLGGIALIALGSGVEGLVALVAAIAGLGGVFVVRSVLVQKSERALIER